MSRHRGRTWLGAALTVAVLLIAASAGLWQLGWVAHWRGLDVPATPPPQPLRLGAYSVEPRPQPAVAHGRAAAAKVRHALASVLPDADLGSHVVVSVAPVRGRSLVRTGHGAFTPASTLKLLTTAAALDRLGPGWRGHTTISLTRPRGGRAATLTVTDRGDILLSASDLRALAAKAARAVGSTRGARVVLRTGSRYAGPATDPHWPASYVAEGVVTPIVPFWVDEGHTPGPDGVLGTEDDGRVADPTAEALGMLAGDLRADHLTVTVGRPAHPAGRGRVVATHTAAPLDQVVAHILTLSDNEGAETLGHLLGGSFAGGVRVTEQTLRKLGVPTTGLRMYDASGLSRDDRVPAATLVAVLQRAARDPRLAGIVEGLPVAGWTGSLADRFDGAAWPGRGVVTAKTGTLTGVSNLAGYVTTADGVPLVVVVAADRIPVAGTVEARDALDDVMAALARCECRARH